MTIRRNNTMRISDFPISLTLTGDESIPILDPNETLSKKRNKRVLLNQVMNIPGPTGPAGKSAYQIWLQQGHTGSANEFLKSLIGRGKSVYETWLDLGNEGSQADFVNSAVGSKILSGVTLPNNDAGNDNDYYVNTIDGYFYYKNNGAWGSELFTLKGTQGPTGAVGPMGPPGANGATGPQGFQGETGTPGAQGQPGATGPQGAQGPTGSPGPTGPAGANGATGPAGQSSIWYNGAGIPSNTLGINGDVYLNSVNGDVYKKASNVWGVAVANIKGPIGATGPTGSQGPQGNTGPTGAAGATGATGPQGIQGVVGPTGPQGPAGTGRFIKKFATTDTHCTYHWNCFITNEDKAIAAGNNNAGQRGDGTGNVANTLATPTYIAIPFDKTPIAIASTKHGGMILTSDNKVYSWGHNQHGERGDGTTTAIAIPKLISITTDTITKILHGSCANNWLGVSAALTSTGRLFVWGYNGYGNLGLGDTTNRTTPVEVFLPGGLKFKDFTIANGSNIYAWSLDGVGGADGNFLYGAGRNDWGNLGTGDTVNKNVFTPVKNNSNVQIKNVKKVIIQTEDDVNGISLFILLNDNAVWCVGNNGSNNLGDNTTVNKNLAIQILTGVSDIETTGGYDGSTLALMLDGTIKGWGGNAQVELGLGAVGRIAVPTSIQVNGSSGGNITNVDKIWASRGSLHSSFFFRKTDKKIYAAGYNNCLHLGIGNNSANANVFTVCLTPEAIKDMTFWNTQDGSTCYYGSYFLGESGNMYYAGRNTNGQGASALIDYIASPQKFIIP